ncbi:hypothetical protein SAMN05421869_13521 [Nonomuraea jiangxiensis]|uniref:Uncharacterized protein n=1 Tax=Nonomuraea jiangxiensis TaxID=633440 RepID=A0A1G9Q1C6_9ACTN|nr:hypothetical protein SAMN05421869_13521 [Nonomuraea jiangxiensis]
MHPPFGGLPGRKGVAAVFRSSIVVRQSVASVSFMSTQFWSPNSRANSAMCSAVWASLFSTVPTLIPTVGAVRNR